MSLRAEIDGVTYAVVLVSPELLLSMAQRGYTTYRVGYDYVVSQNGLPPDTRLVYAFIDPDCPRDVACVVWSAEFAPVAKGERLPILPPPTWTQIDTERRE